MPPVKPKPDGQTAGPPAPTKKAPPKTPTPKTPGRTPPPGGQDPRAGVVTNRPAPRTPYDIWYAENYIYMQPLIAGNPEIEANIVAWFWRAEKENWSDAVISDAIADNIYRGLWNAPQDPDGAGGGGGGRGRGYGGGGGGGGGASTAEQIAQAEAEIRNEAGSLGMTQSDDWFKYVATAVVNGKWSNSMVTDFLVKAIDPATVGAGNVTASLDQIKKMAGDMLIPITDDTARGYANRLLSAEMSMEGLQSLFRTQAIAAHPWAENVINQGITMRDYFQPQRDYLANELEVAPETIDMADTKWRDLSVKQDEKGNTRLATQRELTQAARGRSEWANTSKAANITASAANMLREFMGA